MINALTRALFAIIDADNGLTGAQRCAIHDASIVLDLAARANMPPRSLMRTDGARRDWDSLHKVQERLAEAAGAINNKGGE